MTREQNWKRIVADTFQQWCWLVEVWLAFVVAFVLAKPCFMLYQASAQQFTGSDVISVVGHGLSLDLSTSLYFILLPYLVVLLGRLVPLLPKKGQMGCFRLFRIILRCYFAIASVLVAVAIVVDTSLYEFWGFKLDASVLQFLDGTGHALTSVSAGYVALRIAAILVIAGFLFVVFSKLTILPKNDQPLKQSIPHPLNPSPSKAQLGRASSGSADAHPQKRPSTQTISFVLTLLLLPLIIIGLRGGTSVSTTNVGQVYFSQNQFLNHSAVNPVFSFLSSIGKSTSDIPAYRFFNDEELPKDLFLTPHSPVISCITATTSTPNILLIIMESCGGQFTELGGNAHVTPNLTQLAHEGVYFTRCYANSWRTDRGMLSIMSGYPALPKTSIMKMPSKVRTLPSIASTLQRAGYSTTFLYGGDANFTNTRGYLMATGVETIISEDDFTNEERGSSKWGVCDSITFDRLFNMVGDEQRFLPKEEQRFLPKKTAPWFTTFLTLSSHEPWTVPMPTRFADEKLNAFYYLDRCIGRFIERFRKTEAWKKTLVIIIPDHGILYKDQDETKEIRSHIPMIWTGGVVSQPMQIDKLCNQSDLAATLLGQLGLPHDDFTFSRDILSPDYTRPFAMHTFPEGFSVVDESGFNVYDLNTQHQTIGHSPEAIRLGKMILQLTADDLRSR